MSWLVLVQLVVVAWQRLANGGKCPNYTNRVRPDIASVAVIGRGTRVVVR